MGLQLASSMAPADAVEYWSRSWHGEAPLLVFVIKCGWWWSTQRPRGSKPMSCWQRHVWRYFRITQKIDGTPPRTDFLLILLIIYQVILILIADLLYNAEGANADRCVYGSISTRSFQLRHFPCVCLPNFGETRLGNWYIPGGVPSINTFSIVLYCTVDPRAIGKRLANYCTHSG